MRKDKFITEVLGEEAAITPSDLYNMTFKTSTIGGYDKAEVDAFLERVADVFEELLREIGHLRERTEDQKQNIDTFRELEGSLKTSLATIENYKEEILDSARREADAVIEEARAIRDRASVEAKKLPESIAMEARSLRDVRDSLQHNIASALEAHRILLERTPHADESILDKFPGAPPTHREVQEATPEESSEESSV
ncbi:MAG: DivIVA domain-containing protein [Candidatus Hydrogenedentota bacterium]